ncbi:hypothetical protein CFC21_030333 [Triticum aestivum]|uniref:Uncharacterized protein n=2 Tax=Triticum aestivum TaxID=4565 RepID=A0A9R1JGN4_WHEAT|nr:hypothetical protein CFC21_030333 [Triticum aestivum]
MTLTMSSPMTMLSDASMVEDTSEHRKSTDTSGSSQTSRMPLSSLAAASRNAWFTSSARVFLETCTTRSTTDTLGVGTRSAIPLSLPLRLGSTSATALAAPVEVGTMLSAAARARRRSRWLASSSLWSPVYEWVGMSPLPGAVMSTFLAPASRCLPAPARSTKTPVPSMTRSMPISPHGRLEGLRSDTTLITLPSTEMALSPTGLTSASKMPSVESYLRRWDACFTPPVSLMAITSSGELSPRPCQHRRKLRPMRPNPLIATLSLASVGAFRDPPLVLTCKHSTAASRTHAPMARDQASYIPPIMSYRVCPEGDRGHEVVGGGIPPERQRRRAPQPGELQHAPLDRVGRKSLT